MATNFDDFVGVRRAAEILGLTEGRIRQLVGNHENGEIRAKKVNERAWMIPLSELRKYARKQGISPRE